jgi:hypothetical protein
MIMCCVQKIIQQAILEKERSFDCYITINNIAVSGEEKTTWTWEQKNLTNRKK